MARRWDGADLQGMMGFCLANADIVTALGLVVPRLGGNARVTKERIEQGLVARA